MIDYSLLNAENIVYKVRMKTSSTISKIRQEEDIYTSVNINNHIPYGHL
jgi:hypothetical protein